MVVVVDAMSDGESFDCIGDSSFIFPSSFVVFLINDLEKNNLVDSSTG